MAYIYGLCDADGTLRYIGKANNVEKRLASHMREVGRRDYPLYRWIAKRGRPLVVVLHECGDGEDWREVERRLIAEARARGEKLLNVADGGDEPHCPIEVRRANGRKSKNSGYLVSLRNDRLGMLVHDLKRESVTLLRLARRFGMPDVEERTLARMRQLHHALPHLFPKWADV